MTEDQALTEAFNEGYHAFQIDQSKDMNPYSYGSKLYKEWIVGYDRAVIDQYDDDEEPNPFGVH